MFISLWPALHHCADYSLTGVRSKALDIVCSGPEIGDVYITFFWLKFYPVVCQEKLTGTMSIEWIGKSVGPSSVSPDFSETAAWIQTDFVESFLSTVSPDHLQTIFLFFQNLQFSFFIFFSVFVKMVLYASKNFKTLLLPQFCSDFSTNFIRNLAITFLGDVPKIKTLMILWKFS